MSYAETYTIDVTTASGVATAYSASIPHGRTLTIVYTKTDFAAGVDFTITTETTAQNLWVEDNVNASTRRAPRQSTHDTTGVELTYTGDGDIPSDYIWVVNERVKVVIAEGGDAKTGTFTVVVG